LQRILRARPLGREPGTHNPRPTAVMDSGLPHGACHRAGRRPDPLVRPPE
jgi:hypothetical protein